MRQLFENLINNSLKYAKETEPPVINISYKQAGGYHEILFKDNGIGFDEKYIPQIFKLFQRLHAREQYEGTGLGLAICLKIVEMHRGNIRAASTEGNGASFFVSLPISTS
jgi:light-regulated signal transduction histidine kinase (bacteriophytochrome)